MTDPNNQKVVERIDRIISMLEYARKTLEQMDRPLVSPNIHTNRPWSEFLQTVETRVFHSVKKLEQQNGN